MLGVTSPQFADILFPLLVRLNSATGIDAIYASAAEAICRGLDTPRCSILLFDADGVMRFVHSTGISEQYRKAVEGHSPWQQGAWEPEPLLVNDVFADPTLCSYLPIFEGERIRALAFIPLVHENRCIGKFMVYYEQPHPFTRDEITLAQAIASPVAAASARHASQRQLAEQEVRLRLALQAAEAGVWEWDLASNKVFWSERTYQIHGLPPSDKPWDPFELKDVFHPDDLPKVRHSVRTALAERSSYRIECRVRKPDGQWAWLDVAGAVTLDDHGRPARVIGTTLDFTSRRLAAEELLLANQQLKQANLDFQHFSYAVSHDLQEPLRAISIYAEKVQRTGLTEPAATDIQTVRQAAKRLQGLLDGLRGLLEAGQNQPFEEVDLNLICRDVVAGLRESILETKADIQVDPLPALTGNPAQLEIVFQNLLLNAMRYRSPDRPLRVHLFARSEPGECRVYVSDNGIGIAPEYHDLIFQPFRRLNPERSPGSGLGLAITQRIVERHGGQITLTSEPGAGTTFVLTLPSVTEQPQHCGK